MPTHRLYDNWTWGLTYPAPFDRAGVESSSDQHVSQYTANNTKAKFHAPALRAILAYMTLDTTLSDHDPSNSPGAIGTQGDDYCVGEYPSRTGATQVVVYASKSGRLHANIFTDPTANGSQYLLSDKGASGAAIFFALMPLAIQDQEFKDAYNALANERLGGYADDDALTQYGCILCDNLYRRITNTTLPPGVKIPVNIGTANIPGISRMSLDRGTYSPTTVVFGEFAVLTVNAASNVSAQVIDRADFVGKYQFSNRTFTPTEEKLIPEVPDWYIIPQEAVEVCKHIKETTGTNLPMRNFIARGPAGSGKTRGARAIAAGLKLPYVYQTCGADSDSGSLIGQFVPISEDGPDAADLAERYELPTLDDILMDPPTAYAKLTGEYNEEISEADVYQKLIETVQARALAETGVRPGFRYVESNFIRALRRGYVIELQEPSVISNPGILVSLNGILDDGKSIMLPTGELLDRHPDAVVILTTNVDYAGCRALNQSIKSRMCLHLDIKTPAPDVLIQRVASITGCKDQTLLEKMAATVESIQAACLASSISDGCCGTRELISWVQSYMITGDVMRSAALTVIGAASEQEENQKELIDNCLLQNFA